MQDMQGQMNSMREFQKVESNHSGILSYTWNAPGPQENVFENQFATFSRNSFFYDTHVLQDRLQGGPYGWTAKTEHIGTSIWQTAHSTIIF